MGFRRIWKWIGAILVPSAARCAHVMTVKTAKLFHRNSFRLVGLWLLNWRSHCFSDELRRGPPSSAETRKSCHKDAHHHCLGVRKRTLTSSLQTARGSVANPEPKELFDRTRSLLNAKRARGKNLRVAAKRARNEIPN